MATNAPRTLTSNIVSNWSALVVGAAASLITTPLVVRSLGPELYGIWAFVVAMTSQLMILDFGVRNALVRFLSEARARQDHETVTRLWSTAAAVSASVSLVAALLGLVLTVFLPSIVDVPPSILPAARACLVLLVADAITELMSGLSEGTAAALERYDLLSRLSLFRIGLYTLAVVPTVLSGGELVALAVVTFVSRLIPRIWLFVTVRRLDSSVRIIPSAAAKVQVKKLLAYGGWASVIVIGQRVIFSADVLVVGLVAGAKAAGAYAVALIIIDYVRQVAQSGSTVLTPRLSRLLAHNANQEVQEVFLTYVRFAQGIAYAILIPVLVTGDLFLTLWIGETGVAAVPILHILAVTFLFIAPSFEFLSLFYATDRHRSAAKLVLLEAATNLALSVTLGLQFGPIGVAYGTLAPAILFRGIVAPIIGCKATGLPAGAYFDNLLVAPSIVGISVTLTLVAARTVLPWDSWLSLIAANALGAVATALSGYLLMTRRVRKTALS